MNCLVIVDHKYYSSFSFISDNKQFCSNRYTTSFAVSLVISFIVHYFLLNITNFLLDSTLNTLALSKYTFKIEYFNNIL